MTMAWTLLGVAAVLIVGNAAFVAAETALVTVDRNLVESRAREGSVRFGRVRGTLQRLSTYLSGAQLGITVTSLAIGLVAEPSIATLLREPLEAIGLSVGVTEVLAFAAALLLATAANGVRRAGAEEHRFVATCRERAVGGPPLIGIHEGDASADCGAEWFGEPAIAPGRGGAGGGAALRPPLTSWHRWCGEPAYRARWVRRQRC